VRKILFTVILLSAGLWLALPYWSVWRFNSALAARDSGALADKVDWPTFLTNLKASLGERLRREGGQISIGAKIGGERRQIIITASQENIDELVNRFATAERLPELFALEGLIKPPKSPVSAQTAPAKATPDPSAPPRERRRVTWAFFSGPATFAVHVTIPQRPSEEVMALFEFRAAKWMLADLKFLPRT